MKLSKRLSAIASYVNKNDVVADIGTDHGYIPIYLIENKICNKVIAADVSKPSLEKTISYVSDLGLENQISTRHGDGLQVIRPNEVDTVIIAGMGGVLITKILERSIDVVKTVDNFIFQAMIGTEEIRKYIDENDFYIEDETLVYEEGKYYEVIFAKRGKKIKKMDKFYEIGHKLIEKKDPLLLDFINHKIQYNQNIIDNLDVAKGESLRLRALELDKENSKYKEVLKTYESL